VTLKQCPRLLQHIRTLNFAGLGPILAIQPDAILPPHRARDASMITGSGTSESASCCAATLFFSGTPMRGGTCVIGRTSDDCRLDRVDFLEKPFRSAAFLNKVGKLLGVEASEATLTTAS